MQEIELQKFNYLQMFIEENKAEGSSVSLHIANAVLLAGFQLGPEFIDTSNRADKKHYWLMPPDKLKPLQDEFQFDFDPCPIDILRFVELS